MLARRCEVTLRKGMRVKELTKKVGQAARHGTVLAIRGTNVGVRWEDGRCVGVSARSEGLEPSSATSPGSSTEPDPHEPARLDGTPAISRWVLRSTCRIAVRLPDHPTCPTCEHVEPWYRSASFSFRPHFGESRYE